MKSCIVASLTVLANFAVEREAALAANPVPITAPLPAEPTPPPLYIPPDVKGYQANLLKWDYWVRYYGSQDRTQAVPRESLMHRLFHSRHTRDRSD